AIPELFEHLRATLGPEVQLLHDVHEQLTPIEAAWLAKRLEPYRLFYLEDPLRPEHRQSWPLLRQASTTSLAIGEIFNTRWECLPLFQNGWIDFIRIKPVHVGGITEARKIMTLAEPYNVRSAFHGAADIGPIAQAASVHLQMVIPNFGVQEWSDFTRNEKVCAVFPTPCRFADGYALPNDAPGLGIDYDETEGAKYPYRRAFMPLVRREDGSMHVY
ncbi:MAG: bifunctional D-altronate/D-mannonate dehydratase, partial [Armatimonadetes bacterium]|nr:bifunctional D-altronate/D-mannonate dehydratase [Armatimonadota bacterium]